MTPEQPVTLEAIDELLKSQRLRPFMMEVETDSTIAPDEQAEKTQRIEFLTAVGGFINQASGAVQAFPQSAPFMAEMLKFGAGGFRAGRELGGAIEQFTETVKAGAAQAGGEQEPSPEMVKAQFEAQKMQAEIQMKGKELQLKTQELQMKGRQLQMQAGEKQTEAQIKMQEVRAKAAADRETQQWRIEQERAQMEADIAVRREEFQHRMAEAQQKLEWEREKFAEQQRLELTKLGLEENGGIAAIGEQIAAVSAAMQQAQQMVADFTEQQSRPRRIVRDEFGEIAGVEIDGVGQQAVERDEMGNIVGLRPN